MMHIFLNAVAASAGAGLTYLYNVIPRLSSTPDVRTTLAVQSHLQAEFKRFAGITVVGAEVPPGAMRRFFFEQRELPELIRKSGADILLSAGNFAIRNCPVPQILLSGNSLYTSADFYRDLHKRREYLLCVETKLKGYFARKSVYWADCTVAPSRAFADNLRDWTGREVMAVHHGFDHDVFFGDQSPLSPEVSGKLYAAGDCLRLLFVSHYNYYRNFEILFRAVSLLRDRVPNRKVRLFLTCTLDDKKTPGSYKTANAARLIRELGIREEVVELGAVPYWQLHHIYRACDIYVTPAYAETFAHPLVEAMACGLPIVASDLPVHREIAGQAAVFFPPFSAERLSECLSQVATAENEPSGTTRNEQPDFTWATHVQELLEIATRLRSANQVIELPNSLLTNTSSRTAS